MREYPLLELRNISKSYGKVRALEQVSFVVNPGEFLGLLGPSGSGKTTLLRLIAGLEIPDQGEIILEQKKVSSPQKILAPHKRRMGMIFQDLALWPHMTVKQTLGFSLKGKGFNRKDREGKIMEVLKQVNLHNHLQRYPAQLSGGERQRLAIARALVLEPRILLMDEPFCHLDPLIKEELQGMVIELQQRLGITVIYVSHDQKDIEYLTNRVLVINQGKIEQAGTIEELRNNPRTRFIQTFLSVKKTKNLIRIDPDG